MSNDNKKTDRLENDRRHILHLGEGAWLPLPLTVKI